jgi:hypothetical protein
MPTQVEIKAGANNRPEVEAVERLVAFLAGLQNNSRSVTVQIDQFRRWFKEVLEKHPPIVKAMASSEAVARFVEGDDG